MISESHGFLFVHVPKTAGNSISEKLLPYCLDEKVQDRGHHDGIEDFQLKNPYGFRKHASVNQWVSALGRSKFDDLFKFTVLRNPWERMFSHFMHQQRKTKRGGFDAGRFSRWVHNAWIYDQTALLETRSTPFPFRKLSYYPFDYFLRFESLAEDWETLCGLLKIPFQSLPHRNRGGEKEYRNYYDQDTFRVIARRCHREIKEFSFTF